MIKHTQTNLEPGNCWQTAVACVLEVDPSELPDQVAIEGAKRSYLNALNAYLGEHHALMYSEIPDYQWPVLLIRGLGMHLTCGPTIRTTPERDIHHVVVARNGKMVWDPHPSRAGLTRVDRWGVIAPLPARVAESRARFTGGLRDDMACRCPKCPPVAVDPSGSEPR